MNRRLVLKNAFILTCDQEWRYFQQGAMVIDHDKIEWLGKLADLPEQSSTAAELDLQGEVIIPGLINAHAHGGLSTHRGACDTGDLFTWAHRLGPYTNTLEERDLLLGCYLAIREMVASGITCACDCSRYGAGIFSDVATAVGMRSLSGALANSPELRLVGKPNWPLMLQETERAMEKHAGNNLARFYLGAHSPYSCTPELIRDVKRAGEKLGLGFNIHLAETQREVELVQAQYGCRPVEWLHRLGVLGSDCLLDHCVWLIEEEIDLLQRSGASVAHCSISNAKLGSGVAPIPELLARDIPVGLGTDSMLSNNSQNLFEEMKFSVLLQRASQLNGELLSARAQLTMATREGARALRWVEEIGSLETGKQADLVIMSLSHPRGLTLERVESDLVYASGPKQVKSVMVAGRFIYDRGELTQPGAARLPDLIAEQSRGAK